MNKNSKIFSSSLIFIIIAAITGGSVPVAAKFALSFFKPFTVVALRFFFASIVLLPLVIKSKEFSIQKFKDLLPVSIIGSLNPILLFIALQFTQASFSPLIYAGVPAMTAIYVMFIKKHKIDSQKLVGIIIGLFGVGIIVLLPLLDKGFGSMSVFGNLLIFLASLAFLSYGLISKEKQKSWSVSPIALTFYFSLVTFLISLPFVGYEFMTFGFPTGYSSIHILSGVYIGLVGTGIFYLSYQYALKHGSAITASLFTYLQPITGIGLAALILGERITIPFIIGGTLAIIGAQIASRNKKKSV
ncbi:MAG: DMT family transporter [Pseudomonadales bacterium]|nr:DMT family transporter [Pseudomonadales bacterium]